MPDGVASDTEDRTSSRSWGVVKFSPSLLARLPWIVGAFVAGGGGAYATSHLQEPPPAPAPVVAPAPTPAPIPIQQVADPRLLDQLTQVKLELGAVHAVVDNNTKAIDEVKDDVRELRRKLERHLERRER